MTWDKTSGEERPRPLPKPEVRHRRCYQVTVKGGHHTSTFRPTGDGQTANEGRYLNCANAVIHVITDDPKIIYTKFGTDTVVSICDIGPGYSLPDDVP